MAVSRRRATVASLFGSGTNLLIITVQGIVLVPLYLHAIGPRLYGAWLGSGEILVWMQALDLGLPNLMIQRIGAAHGKGDTKSVGEYFCGGLVALAVVALCVGMGAAALAFHVPGWMSLHGDEAAILSRAFLLGSVATALNIVNNAVVGFSRGIQDTGLMNAALVVSSLFGFGVSVLLLLMGWGLYAIALGLVARTVVLVLGSAVFVARALRGEMRRFFRVRRAVLREFGLVSPVTALAGIAYAAMAQSESAIAAIFLAPELAVVLNLTRKALDVMRGIVDMIAFSTYGGFAHLVATGNRRRAAEIHAEVSALRLSLAVVVAAAYMAVNGALVTVWVGPEQYGGAALTMLMAAQFIVAGSAFLYNYLYRAAGEILKGSIALVVESVVRMAMMFVLIYFVGLPALPIAAILTASISGWIYLHWTRQLGIAFVDHFPTRRSLRRVWALRAALLAAGATCGIVVYYPSWTYVLLAGMAYGAAGLLLIAIDPRLVTTRAMLAGLLTRGLRRRRAQPAVDATPSNE